MKKRKIILLIIVIIIFICGLGLYFYNLKSENFIVINNENDLETALDKKVFMRAELYASKLPILKFGDTYLYLWPESEENILKGRVANIIRDQGIERGSERSVKVKVWGKLGKHKSVSLIDQLRSGVYEITYSRIEIDDR